MREDAHAVKTHTMSLNRTVFNLMKHEAKMESIFIDIQIVRYHKLKKK